MKKTRRSLILLAIAAVMVLAMSASVFAANARKIQAKRRMTIGSTSSFSVQLNPGESIANLKSSNAKALSVRQGGYALRTYVDTARNAEDGYNRIYIQAYAKKVGKYTISFNIKSGKKVVKKNQKITVYVINDTLKSIKFAGKEYSYKYLDQYHARVRSHDIYTCSAKGKLKITPNMGYKIKSIEYYDNNKVVTDSEGYQEKGAWVKMKNGGTLKLKENPSNDSYTGSTYSYKEAIKARFKEVEVRVTLYDTFAEKEKNEETGKMEYPTTNYYIYLYRRNLN